MATIIDLVVLGGGTILLLIGLNLLMMLSSYWKYFVPMAPVLVLYGALAAFGFHYAIPAGWYMWHPIIIGVLLYGTFQNSRDQYAILARMSEPLATRSAKRTLIFLAASMALYIFSFLGAVIYIHNEPVVRELIGR